MDYFGILPPELVDKIFSYLDYESLCVATILARKWQENRIFMKRTKVCIRFTTFYQNHEKRLEEVHRTFLKSSRTYKYILFEDYRYWTFVQAILSKFGDQLVSLELCKTNNNIDDKDLNFDQLSCFLHFTPNLQLLKFDYCQFDPQQNYYFPKLDSLQRLQIDFVGMNYESYTEEFYQMAVDNNWCDNLIELYIESSCDNTFQMLLESNYKTIKETSNITYDSLMNDKVFKKAVDLDLHELQLCVNERQMVPTFEERLNTFMKTQANLRSVFLRIPTNRSVYETICENCKELEVLQISCYMQLDSRVTKLLCLLPQLKTLKIQQSRLPFESFELKSTFLESLIIENANDLSPECVIQIGKQLPNLRTLKLDYSNGVTDLSLNSICHNLLKLEVLSLEHCELFSDGGLEYISKLRNLRYLNLNRCSHVSGDCLFYAHLPHLETLLLESSCEKLMPQHFESFGRNFPKLKRLEIVANDNVNDKVIGILTRRLHELEELVLGDLQNLTNKGVSFIVKNCRRIRKLVIRECPKVKWTPATLHTEIKTSARLLHVEVSDD